MTDQGDAPARHEQVDRALVGARDLIEFGWPEDAVEPLTAALALHGDDAEVLRHLVVAFWLVGDDDAAMVAAHRAIATDPEDVSGYLLAATVAERRGDIESSRAALDAALALDPADGSLPARRLALDLRAGRIEDETFAVASRAAATHPTDADISVMLAWLAEREGHDGIAELALASAVTARPADPAVRSFLVTVQERRGRTLDVVANAATVLAEHPDARGPLDALRRGVVRTVASGNGFLVVGMVLGLLGGFAAWAVDAAWLGLVWGCCVLVAVVWADVALVRSLRTRLRSGWSPFVRVVRGRATGAVIGLALHAAAVATAALFLVLLAVSAPEVVDVTTGATGAGILALGIVATGFLDRWYT